MSPFLRSLTVSCPFAWTCGSIAEKTGSVWIMIFGFVLVIVGSCVTADLFLKHHYRSIK